MCEFGFTDFIKEMKFLGTPILRCNQSYDAAYMHVCFAGSIYHHIFIWTRLTSLAGGLTNKLSKF